MQLRVRRAVGAVFIGASALGAAVVFGGGESAAAAACTAENGQRVAHTVGGSACSADAGKGSRAHAEDTSNFGTAVAVAESGGNANAFNREPGSAALASAESGGTSYSVTAGPKSFSLAQARRGGVTVAVAGWGGQAVADRSGVYCGGIGVAYDSTTGAACLKWGAIDLH